MGGGPISEEKTREGMVYRTAGMHSLVRNTTMHCPKSSGKLKVTVPNRRVLHRVRQMDEQADSSPYVSNEFVSRGSVQRRPSHEAVRAVRVGLPVRESRPMSWFASDAPPRQMVLRGRRRADARACLTNVVLPMPAGPSSAIATACVHRLPLRAPIGPHAWRAWPVICSFIIDSARRKVADGLSARTLASTVDERTPKGMCNALATRATFSAVARDRLKEPTFVLVGQLRAEDLDASGSTWTGDASRACALFLTRDRSLP